MKTFDETFKRVQGDAMDIALKLVGDGFSIVPGVRWMTSEKTPRVLTLGRGIPGSMTNPLSGPAAMGAVLDLRDEAGHEFIDSGYYLGLGPVGDTDSHVLCVLDVDNAHGDGQEPLEFDDLFAALVRWFDELGCPEALDTLAVKTPGRGIHLMFWCEAALGWAWQIGLKVPGLPDEIALDWLTASGNRHETGPGSRRPRTRTSTGGEYELFVPTTKADESLGDVVREIPDALLRLLVTKAIEAHNGRVNDLFSRAGDMASQSFDFRVKRALAFPAIADIVRDAVDASKRRSKKQEQPASASAATCDEVGLYRHEDVAGQGTRHDALVRFAGACVHRCTGRDFDDTCRIVREEIEAFAERRCSPPLLASDREVQSVIHDAIHVWAEQARGEIEGRIRSRVVVVDQSGERSVQVVRDYAEREVNGARYRCKIKRGGQVGLPVASPANVVEALLHDEGLAGRFAYDDCAKAPMVVAPLPWSDPDETFPRPATDVDRSEAICYLDDVLGVDFSRVFQVGFDKACNKAKFNPLKDFVRSFDGKWDGKAHLDHLVSDWLGVDESDKIAGKSFSGEVMRLFLRGAVRRALHPGAKFDYCPIFQGGQGIGKSTFVQWLVGDDDLVCESLSDVRDEARCWEQMSGRLVILIDELCALSRASDVARVKQFLTTCKDERRLPYAKLQTVRPRSCVFCGTTNDLSFLYDRSGGRRFLPIQCTGVWGEHGPLFMNEGKSRFLADVEQCWAEAYALEAANPDEPLVLPDWCREEQTERTEAASVDSPWAAPIALYLQQAAELHPDEPVCFAQMYSDIQNCTWADYRDKMRRLKSFQDEARRIGAAMGWTYKRAFGTFGVRGGLRQQQWALVPPEITPDERRAIHESRARAMRQFEADEAPWTGEEDSDESPQTPLVDD